MKKILVIDDDHDLLETIQSVLQYEGYHTFAASNAQEGIKIVKEHPFDLILMDVMMPGMSGADAVKFLEDNFPDKQAPVIFLTGLASSDDTGGAALNVGGKHYPAMAKPFDNHKLLKMVKEILEKPKTGIL